MIKPKRNIAYSLAFTLCSLFFVNHAGAGDVPKRAEDVQPIMVGETIPNLTLTSADNKAVNLNQAVKKQPTLLVFYRGGWCPYCNTHLADLRKIEDELKALGFQIFAISPDQPKFLQQTDAKHKLGYTLLSDSDMNAAKALGIAFEVDKETREQYQQYGIDLEKSSGQKHHLLPVPAAFLLNKEGQITFSFVAPDYTTRVDNEILLAAAKAQLKAPKKTAKE